jgi:hypothetical protein
VLVGRTVATIAELAFMAQVAAAVGGISRRVSFRPGVLLSRAIVPMIFVAECFSWWAVLTANFLGNSFEESIWDFNSVLLVICFTAIARRATAAGTPAIRRFAVTGAVLAACHVVFMSLVDVPMYVTRYLAERGRPHPFDFHDLATRWVVTFRWSDWHSELAWMALYFSVAVWGSLALIRAPRLWSTGS